MQIRLRGRNTYFCNRKEKGGYLGNKYTDKTDFNTIYNFVIEKFFKFEII